MKRFKVLPGASITFNFDFTGMILDQFGKNWLIDPHCKSCIVLKQPEKDINGKQCVSTGSVSIDKKYLKEQKIKLLG
ncbi:MAG: hypothetical protein M0R80_13425 [Proteobacteria bacterium]|jgi:hypothetical protein|nr:hypothetical protein [Pseudomonadota bacterium]